MAWGLLAERYTCTVSTFKDKPLERLIGEGVKAEQINDDALGRCLDRLYEFGVSSLYQDLGETVVSRLGLGGESLHLDSTSFHYDGQSNDVDDDVNTIHIAKGYSRDHRLDLNQVVLNLICENQSGIPVYMKPASGNCNDMDGFKKIVLHLYRQATNACFMNVNMVA